MQVPVLPLSRGTYKLGAPPNIGPLKTSGVYNNSKQLEDA
jgi:hypothetical protein